MDISVGASHKDKLVHALIESWNRTKELFVVLLKSVFPYFILTAILKQTGLLDLVSMAMAPVMSLWDLPGEASAVLVAGMLISPYSAVAVLVPLNLDAGQITMLGFMISVAHSLPVEGAIIREMLPGSFWSMTILRVLLALGGGWVLAQVL